MQMFDEFLSTKLGRVWWLRTNPKHQSHGEINGTCKRLQTITTSNPSFAVFETVEKNMLRIPNRTMARRIVAFVRIFLFVSMFDDGSKGYTEAQSGSEAYHWFLVEQNVISDVRGRLEDWPF